MNTKSFYRVRSINCLIKYLSDKFSFFLSCELRECNVSVRQTWQVEKEKAAILDFTFYPRDVNSELVVKSTVWKNPIMARWNTRQCRHRRINAEIREGKVNHDFSFAEKTIARKETKKKKEKKRTEQSR